MQSVTSDYASNLYWRAWVGTVVRQCRSFPCSPPPLAPYIVVILNCLVISLPTLLHSFHLHLKQPTGITTMAFIVRRPFAVTTSLKQLTKSPASTTRLFHNTPLKSNTFFASRPANSKPTTSSPFKSSQSLFQNAFRRSYQTGPSYAAPQATRGLGQNLLYGAAIVGGTVVATNLIFNRETREDGGMPPFEREYLNQTFAHTGLGLGVIAIAARALHSSGWSYRLMAANPWVVFGVGLAAGVGTMMGTFYTHPDK